MIVSGTLAVQLEDVQRGQTNAENRWRERYEIQKVYQSGNDFYSASAGYGMSAVVGRFKTAGRTEHRAINEVPNEAQPF